jgi:CRISPR-associated exonuclease Cas4
MAEQEAEDPIMISALQHYSYCPRQCALIHQEQVFDENVYTLRGRAVHERVDEPESQLEDGVRVERALPLYSERLGLTGKADVVEIHAGNAPYPVEYKHGQRRPKEHDDIQLAAQAMCLEEMTGKTVTHGAIYHHGSRRRREVEITAALRKQVEETTAAVRALLQSGKLPPPVNDERCRHCSLNENCQPEALSQAAKVHHLRTLLYEPGDSQ